ncbi:hypothetical protein PSH77_04170 [Pseudomonas extremorientalis]|uniref:hypothetical protein n=1 Tax=Pseudomonas extremorientalis TaxID=169669 RepID=UPI0027350394|nr:hypothetical protein [Pseudomonas extremorientalis]WLG57717.1 hypothetical protein PSH77_04170 [Pseudomonas extremorientalis]
MARIDNPDKVKNAINAAQREQARLAKICNDQANQIRALKMPKPAPGWSGENAGEMLTAIRRRMAMATN